MVCATCGQNHSQSKPLFNVGGTSSCKKTLVCDSPNINWLIPVTDLPDITAANRTHAYVNEAGQVFILNYAGDGWLMIEGGDATQIQSDWNVTDITDPAYIKNKPDVALKSDLDPLLAKDINLQNQINNIYDVIDEIHERDDQQDDKLNDQVSRITVLENNDSAQDDRLDDAIAKNNEQDSRLNGVDDLNSAQNDRITELENTNFTPTNWVYNSEFHNIGNSQMVGWDTASNKWYQTLSGNSMYNGSIGMATATDTTHAGYVAKSKPVFASFSNQYSMVVRAMILNYPDSTEKAGKIGVNLLDSNKTLIQSYEVDASGVPNDRKEYLIGQEFNVNVTSTPKYIQFYVVAGGAHTVIKQPAVYVKANRESNVDYFKYFPSVFGLSELTDWNDIQNKPAIPDDNNLVHKTDRETINGLKHFTSAIRVGDPSHPDILRGITPDGTDYKIIDMHQSLDTAGAGVVFGSGGLTAISSGDSYFQLQEYVGGAQPWPPNLSAVSNGNWGDETAYVTSDASIRLVSNMQNVGEGHEFKLDTNGKLYLDQKELNVGDPEVINLVGNDDVTLEKFVTLNFGQIIKLNSRVAQITLNLTISNSFISGSSFLSFSSNIPEGLQAASSQPLNMVITNTGKTPQYGAFIVRNKVQSLGYNKDDYKLNDTISINGTYLIDQ